jgi:hypothetical protein
MPVHHDILIHRQQATATATFNYVSLSLIASQDPFYSTTIVETSTEVAGSGTLPFILPTQIPYITSVLPSASTPAGASNSSHSNPGPSMGVIVGLFSGLGTFAIGLGILVFVICFRKRQRKLERAVRSGESVEPDPFRVDDQQITQDKIPGEMYQFQQTDCNTSQTLDAIAGPTLSRSPEETQSLRGQRMEEPSTLSQIDQMRPLSLAYIPLDRNRRRSQKSEIWNDNETVADPDATPPPTYSTGGRLSRHTSIFSPDRDGVPPVPPPPFDSCILTLPVGVNEGEEKSNIEM